MSNGGGKLERISRAIDDLFGKPKWKITKEAKEALKGLYVKEENFPFSPKLVPATPTRLLYGRVLEDFKGGAVLFNEKGEEVGHIQVDYSDPDPILHLRSMPLALWFKGKLIAYVEAIKRRSKSGAKTSKGKKKFVYKIYIRAPDGGKMAEGTFWAKSDAEAIRKGEEWTDRWRWKHRGGDWEWTDVSAEVWRVYPKGKVDMWWVIPAFDSIKHLLSGVKRS